MSKRKKKRKKEKKKRKEKERKRKKVGGLRIQYMFSRRGVGKTKEIWTG